MIKGISLLNSTVAMYIRGQQRKYPDSSELTSIFIMKRNTPTQNALVSAGTISTITVKSIANLKTIIKSVKMAFHKPSLSTEVVSHQGYEAVGWVKMEGQSCKRSCRGQKSCLDPKS